MLAETGSEFGGLAQAGAGCHDVEGALRSGMPAAQTQCCAKLASWTTQSQSLIDSLEHRWEVTQLIRSQQHGTGERIQMPKSVGIVENTIAEWRYARCGKFA